MESNESPRIKVLWVEDEPHHMYFERLLAEGTYGWDITLTDTIQEALELANALKFDLVVADLMLSMNAYQKNHGFLENRAGIELIRELKSSDRKGATPPTVPLLVITAVGAVDRGGGPPRELEERDRFLAKPVPEDLYEQSVKELTNEILHGRATLAGKIED